LRVDHLARHLPADVANFPLQIPDAGLSRVVLNQPLQSVVGKLDLVVRQSGLLHLFADQETLGDLQLLIFGVAGKPDDLHPVLQGGWNRVQNVSRRDEEDLTQIILHIQIVVNKHKILLGIQHFEQGG
jgi:hypothetical protein